MKNKYLYLGLSFLIILIFALPVLAEEIGGKVQVGSDIYISAEEHVRGDSVAIFGSQKIKGKVDGSVVVIFGDLELSGEVDDDVVTIFGKVILQDGARITGDLVNVMGEVIRTGNVSVGGEQTTVDVGDIGQEITHNIKWNFHGLKFWRFPFFHISYFGLVLSLLITLLVAYFFMNNLTNIVEVIEQETVHIGLKGLIGSVVIIFGSFLLTITIIGVPVAVLLLMATWLAVNLGAVAVYYLIGIRLAEQLQWETTDLVKTLVGALIIGVIALLPLGWLVKFVVGCLGLGGVLETKFGTKKPWVE